MQGPFTEPAAVDAILHSLREGVDCHVKLTNYRRDGTTFQNLLSLVPVFDTHGVYRFVVGLQFEVVPGAQQMRKLLWVQRLLDQLPRTMPVHYPKPARPPHAKPRRQLAATKAAEAAAAATTQQRLEAALAGKLAATKEVKTGARFASEYQRMRASIVSTRD